MADLDGAKLLQRMKRTKSNRFNFAARLKAKAEIKSNTINVLALVSIVASIYLLTYADHLSNDATRLVGVIVAGVSVAALIMSLQDPVSDLARRASEAHRCAREISNLYGKLQVGAVDVVKARDDYEAILNVYENHSEIDNWKTLYERSDEFPDDSKGANWWNGGLQYNLSKFSSSIFAVILVACVVAIWFCLIGAENYFVERDKAIAENALGRQK